MTGIQGRVFMKFFLSNTNVKLIIDYFGINKPKI